MTTADRTPTDPIPTRGFLRENWFWILLPFLILGALAAWLAITSDLSQVFPWFYTPN